MAPRPRPGSRAAGAKAAVQTANAPAAIGPYSQAVLGGGWMFVSGQVALDPATGRLVEGGVREQTERVIRNIGAVLEAAGAGLDRVVKTTVYMTDLTAFVEMNEIYANHFAPPYPARATVQVAALPKGALVEIDAVAHLGRGGGR